MKGFYRLLNYEFSAMLKVTLWICLVAIVAPIVFLNRALKNYSTYSVHERFETIYASSGAIFCFLLCLVVLCAFFLKTFYANFWGSKSIYTLLALPVKREALFFSKLVAFMISLLLLLAAQFISIYLGYEYVADRVLRATGPESGLTDGPLLLRNGLFLAFIRSEFLRILLPLTPLGLLSTVSLSLVIVTGTYYGAICERSKRYWGFLPLALALWMILQTIGDLTAEPYFYVSTASLITKSIFLIGFSLFFLWHGLRLMKKGSVG